MPIFLMRLLYGHDLLDNNQFLVLVDLVKRRVTPGDVKPVENNPAPEDQFFLIPLAPWERIVFQPFQGGPDNSAGLIRKTVNLLRQLMPENQAECQSLISERETYPSFLRLLQVLTSSSSRRLFRSSIISAIRSV